MYIIIQYIIYIILFQLSALYLYEKKISYNIQKSLLNYWNLHIVEVGKKKRKKEIKDRSRLTSIHENVKRVNYDNA